MPIFDTVFSKIWSGINRAVAHAEWKAATVLARAAIEALLLWRVNVPPPMETDIRAAITSGLKKKF